MIIYPGNTGEAVRELQQALLERGALPPEASSEEQLQFYGPWTQGAVRTFQAKHGLAQDMIVGPQTWAALQRDDGDAAQQLPQPDYAEAGQLMGRALFLALGELQQKVAEVPLGSNRGPRVDEYLVGRRGDGAALLHYRQVPSYPDGWQGAPWCGRFALWCIELAAAQLGVASPVDGWGDLASALKWKEQALKRGRFANKPKAGRAALIIVPPGPNGEKAHGHVMLVARSLGDAIITVEGNSANRDASRRRPISELAGFVDLS